jgi:DNA-binding transcriptional MerR regulator
MAETVPRLIQTPARSTSGYRLFDDRKIRNLTFVRRARELGFSLDEIKELLALRQKQHACSEVQSMLKSKLTDVRAKIEVLVDLQADLRGVLRICNRELRLKPAVKHEDCCPLPKRLGRINGANGKMP